MANFRLQTNFSHFRNNCKLESVLGESVPDKYMFGKTHSGMASEILRTSSEIFGNLGIGGVVFENLIMVTLKISPACDSGNVCRSVKVGGVFISNWQNEHGLFIRKL